MPWAGRAQCNIVSFPRPSGRFLEREVAPQAEDLSWVVRRFGERALRWRRRHGLRDDRCREERSNEVDQATAPGACAQLALRIGPLETVGRRGRPDPGAQDEAAFAPRPGGCRSAEREGFRVHAGVRIACSSARRGRTRRLSPASPGRSRISLRRPVPGRRLSALVRPLGRPALAGGLPASPLRRGLPAPTGRAGQTLAPLARLPGCPEHPRLLPLRPRGRMRR